MTAVDITGLYDTLRTRISVHAPTGCSAISLKLSPDFADELAFYRLVFWGYALVHEAARTSFSFLTSLAPLKADRMLRKETSNLRTFLAHNMDRGNQRHRKIYDFVHRWFSDACGERNPESSGHFMSCCTCLGNEICRGLSGAIAACDLLDDSVDGVRLVADLKERLGLAWEARRFDPIVARCADRLGNPRIDLHVFRRRNLERWRQFLTEADATNREQALEQRIEADLLAAMDGALPTSVREGLQRVAASPDAIAAALLLLSDAQRVGTLTTQQIIDLINSSVP